MLPWAQPVALVNARVLTPEGLAPSLRFGSAHPVDRRVAAPGRHGRRSRRRVRAARFDQRARSSRAESLRSAETADRYDNAAAWIDDLRPAIRSDPSIRAGQRHPLAARLFIGALKNLLSGVTTVAHHNPRYREIGRSFPVRVLRRYGWAHSFTLEGHPVGARGEPGGNVRERCLATPPDVPFMVHAARGRPIPPPPTRSRGSRRSAACGRTRSSCTALP